MFINFIKNKQVVLLTFNVILVVNKNTPTLKLCNTLLVIMRSDAVYNNFFNKLYFILAII